MRVQNISFKGYVEQGTKKILLEEACNELDKARPYLKLIGESLPCDKDLFLKVENDGANDVFIIGLKDKKSGEFSKVLEKTEHDFIGNGFWLTEDTFKGLANHSKELFAETAKNFCLNFSKLEKDLDPNFRKWIRDIAELTSHCDYCC